MAMFNKKRYLSTYNEYVNNDSEILYVIKYTPLETEYKIKYVKSQIFKNEYDYNFIFCLNSGNEYILQLIYFKDYVGEFAERHLYNVSFTTMEQYLKSLNLKSETEQELVYEMPTNRNENTELTQKIIYIFSDFENNINPHDDCLCYRRN